MLLLLLSQKPQGSHDALDPSSQPMTARRDLNTQDEKKHYAATPLNDFRVFNKGVGIVKEGRSGYAATAAKRVSPRHEKDSIARN